MRRIIFRYGFLSLLFSSNLLFSQEWVWVEDKSVLNPSGLEIQDDITLFRVLDWNSDGFQDFVLNQQGKLQLFQNRGDDTWFRANTFLPVIGWNIPDPNHPQFREPKNFQLIDWDEDGDYELVADSAAFWWNTSTNMNPVWVRDDTLLQGLPKGRNLFLDDLDADGDWDAIVDHYYTNIYTNVKSNQNPVWVSQDTLSQDAFQAQFVRLDSDSLMDLAIVSFVPADPGLFLSLSLVENRGNFSPRDLYERHGAAWGAFGKRVTPAYDLVDFNNDNLFDIVKNDWWRHIVTHFNIGSPDSAIFDTESLGSDSSPDQTFGPVNVQSKARPYFFDVDVDGLDDLIVQEDVLTFFIFLCGYFEEGRTLAFKNLGAQFDPGFSISERIPRPFQNHPSFTNGITLSFADINQDGNEDFIASGIRVNCDNEILWRNVLFFRNVGTGTEPDWQPDSTRFTFFLQPDSMFYDPQFFDVDKDGDYDLFVQKEGIYRFYEKLNSEEESWRWRNDWGSGLQDLPYYSVVLFDLTRDGKDDVVFGTRDGFLELYENMGLSSSPVWQKVPEAFTGIDVDSLAAPALSDLNDDGLLDLVVGNAEGLLFYYRNESTVSVSEAGQVPEEFTLFPNYPNPFNPETTIRFQIPKAAMVALDVFNTLGQKVRALQNNRFEAGEHQVRWNGRNDFGLQVPSGIYFVRMRATGINEREPFSTVNKVTLMK